MKKKRSLSFLFLITAVIFTTGISLSGCGGGGGGSGSTPSLSNVTGGSGQGLSFIDVTGYGGNSLLNSGNVTVYSYDGGASSEVGTCSITTSSSLGPTGNCFVYFTWNGNTTTSYYAVITDANGNPDATLIGAWVPAGTYTSTLGAFVALSGYVDETTTAITAQLASSIGGNLFMSASNNYQLGTNGMVFGEISTDNMTNYIPGESYLSSKTSLTSTQLDTIEYVADALALCVQTQNQCSNLFADSENGSGVQPSDTLQAAINLALDIEYTTGYNSLLGLSSAQTNLNNMLSFTNGLMSSSLPYDFASGSQITGYGSLNFGNLII